MDRPTRLSGLVVAAILALASPLPALTATGTDQSPYIVVDVDSGAVVASRQADQPWYPASLTKLMTVYLTFRAMADGKVAPATLVTQTAAAVAQEPVRMGFGVGTKMTVDNALKMMIVPSANDIAVTVAESIGGTLPAFLDAMNGEAARLGMGKTHFDNPNGLPAPAQVSTARDLAVLARQIWTEFPEQRSLFGIQAIKVGASVFHSPNLMLLERYPGAGGMKTGFTCAAGYNLAATATRDGRTLLVVVLGRTSASDRAELAARLLDQGFAARTQESDPEPLTLAAFSDEESDAGPTDMRICSGTGVDRAGFADSVLGPVVAVTNPVTVVTKGGPAAPATPAAKPAAKPVATAAKPAKGSATVSIAPATKGKPMRATITPMIVATGGSGATPAGGSIAIGVPSKPAAKGNR